MSLKPLIAASLVFLSSTASALTYEVMPGDSLWKIASQHTEGQVTTHQMLAAIHSANQTTLGENINSIQAGMRLEIPDVTVAQNADSKIATRLLSDSPSTTTQTSAQARALMHKIDNVEREIRKTMEEMKASQSHFESSMN